MEDVDPLNQRGICTNPLTKRPYSQTFKDTSAKWSGLPLYSDPAIVSSLQNALATTTLVVVVTGTGSGKTRLAWNWSCNTCE